MCHIRVRGAHRLLVVKSEGRRSLARPRRKCESNFKMHFKGRRRKRVDWIDVHQVGTSGEIL
jgi:hypothetical protein